MMAMMAMMSMVCMMAMMFMMSMMSMMSMIVYVVYDGCAVYDGDDGYAKEMLAADALQWSDAEQAEKDCQTKQGR